MSVIQKTKVVKDVPTDKKTFMQVCKKWDRRIAPAFGLLAFFTLVGIVIYNLIYAESTNCETKEIDTPILYTNFEPKCSFQNKTCTVYCSHIIDNGEGLIAFHINAVLSENTNCGDSNDLIIKLDQCDFPNKTLKKDWLKDILYYDVDVLTISGGNLEKIDEGALAGDPFDYLRELILIELKMKTLKKEYFLGMNSLDSFEFRLNTIGELRVEENALKGLKVLSRMSYSRIKFDEYGLSNSFGCTGAKLDKLQILDLQYGSIEKLTECSFSNISSIVSIYLHKVGLTFIDKNAFIRNPYIDYLDLSQNNLITLENGTFARINKNSGESDVYLGNNPWNCTCSLEWLKDDFLQKDYIDRNLPPLCNNYQNFTEVPFCSGTTSTEHITPTITSTEVLTTSASTSTTEHITPTITSTEVLTTPTSTSTTEHITPTTTTGLPTTTIPPPVQLKIDCSIHDQSPISINAEVIFIHSVSVTIDDNCINLQFREYSTDPLKIQVVSNVSLEKYILVWFDSNNKSYSGCETPIYNSILLENLKRDTTYTFSVLAPSEKAVSPKCTFGLKTTAEWDKRSWITNKYRTVVISVIASSIVLIIILAILGTFCFIRTYPTVISGNKSVIVVKPKKENPDFEPPRNFEKPVYWDPYLKPISQGYLTPKFHKYHRVKYRPPLTRSFSEWSLTNNSSPYDDPRHIYDMRILHSRLQERNTMLRNCVSDFRPPLPPPNGRNRMHLATDFDEESLYNSV